jgi:TP901 family phage tail tape measure protein
MASDTILIQMRLQAPSQADLTAATRQIQRALSNISANVQIKNGPQAVQALKQIKTGTDAATRSTTSFGEAIGLSARRFVAFTSAVAIVGRLTSALSRATREAVKFEREFVKLAQVFDTDVRSLGALQNSLSDLSREFGLSATVIARTSVVLAQSGLTAKQTEQAMSTLAKTTLAATFDSIASSTEGAVAIMAQFGTEASKLESQLGAINAVSKRFAVESGDIIEAVRRSGGAFRAAGGTLNEFIALFTSVRSTTRESAETIATGFRTIFARLQRPKTIEFFRELNIELTDGRGNFIGAFEAIKRLSEGLKQAGIQAGSIQFAGIVEQLGGIRQVSRVIPLLQQFTKAELARQVAIAGGNSLDKDAAKAQATLAQSFARTTENFSALIREISQTASFKAIVTVLLDLANAFIEVARSLKPLIPLIATFAAFKIGKLGIAAVKSGIGGAGGAGGLGKGFNKGGKVLGFNRGGTVPGTGNGDTVPAMLEPGEFVIRKSAVQAFGTKKLSKINKYATGGPINNSNIGAKYTVPPTFTYNKDKNKDFVRTGSEKNPRTSFNSSDTYSFQEVVQGIRVTDKDFAGNKELENQYRGRLNPKTQKRAKPDFIQRGRAFEQIVAKRKNVILAKKQGGDNAKTSRLDGVSSKGDLVEIKSTSKSAAGGIGPKVIGGALEPRSANVDGILQKRLKKQILNKNKNNINFGKVILYQDRTGPLGRMNEKQKKAEAEKLKKAAAQKKTAATIASIRTKRAAGGSIPGAGTDTVPALLTPGEFVINKKSAQSFGYGKLGKINKYAKGGPVGVQKFAGGGLARPGDFSPSGSSTITRDSVKLAKQFNIRAGQLQAAGVTDKTIEKLKQRVIAQIKRATISGDKSIKFETLLNKSTQVLAAAQKRQALSRSKGGSSGFVSQGRLERAGLSSPAAKKVEMEFNKRAAQLKALGATDEKLIKLKRRMLVLIAKSKQRRDKDLTLEKVLAKSTKALAKAREKAAAKTAAGGVVGPGIIPGGKGGLTGTGGLKKPDALGAFFGLSMLAQQFGDLSNVLTPFIQFLGLGSDQANALSKGLTGLVANLALVGFAASSLGINFTATRAASALAAEADLAEAQASGKAAAADGTQASFGGKLLNSFAIIGLAAFAAAKGFAVFVDASNNFAARQKALEGKITEGKTGQSLADTRELNKDFKDTNRTKQVGGAALGAAGGAAAGAFFAPFTLGISVLVGAAVGGFVGLLTGYYSSIDPILEQEVRARSDAYAAIIESTKLEEKKKNILNDVTKSESARSQEAATLSLQQIQLNKKATKGFEEAVTSAKARGAEEEELTKLTEEVNASKEKEKQRTEELTREILGQITGISSNNLALKTSADIYNQLTPAQKGLIRELGITKEELKNTYNTQLALNQIKLQELKLMASRLALEEKLQQSLSKITQAGAGLKEASSRIKGEQTLDVRSSAIDRGPRDPGFNNAILQGGQILGQEDLANDVVAISGALQAVPQAIQNSVDILDTEKDTATQKSLVQREAANVFAGIKIKDPDLAEQFEQIKKDYFALTKDASPRDALKAFQKSVAELEKAAKEAGEDFKVGLTGLEQSLGIYSSLLVERNKKESAYLNNLLAYTERFFSRADKITNLRGGTVTRTDIQQRTARSVASLGFAGQNGVQLANQQGNANRLAANMGGGATDEDQVQQQKDLQNSSMKAGLALKEYNKGLEQQAGIIEQQIEKEKALTQARRDFSEQFVFGTNEQRQDQLGNLANAQQAARQGNLAGASEDQRSGILSILKQFENAAVFDGQTGAQVQGEIMANELLRAGLINQQEATELRKGGSSKEDGLINSLEGIYNEQNAIELKVLDHQQIAFNTFETGVTSFAEGVREFREGLVASGQASVPATSNPVVRATGGMIYADEGTLVNFKPKGTDTVPAMLTPGEFVVRKSSVDKYGSGMMEKINAGNFADGGIIEPQYHQGNSQRGGRRRTSGRVSPGVKKQKASARQNDLSDDENERRNKIKLAHDKKVRKKLAVQMNIAEAYSSLLYHDWYNAALTARQSIKTPKNATTGQLAELGNLTHRVKQLGQDLPQGTSDSFRQFLESEVQRHQDIFGDAPPQGKRIFEAVKKQANFLPENLKDIYSDVKKNLQQIAALDLLQNELVRYQTQARQDAELAIAQKVAKDGDLENGPDRIGGPSENSGADVNRAIANEDLGFAPIGSDKELAAREKQKAKKKRQAEQAKIKAIKLEKQRQTDLQIYNKAPGSPGANLSEFLTNNLGEDRGRKIIDVYRERGVRAGRIGSGQLGPFKENEAQSILTGTENLPHPKLALDGHFPTHPKLSVLKPEERLFFLWAKSFGIKNAATARHPDNIKIFQSARDELKDGFLAGANFADIATPSKFNTGGSVGGAPGIDTNPAMLTRGEFVINKQSAQAIGQNNLNRLNSIKGYNEGGPVGYFATGGSSKSSLPSGSLKSSIGLDTKDFFNTVNKLIGGEGFGAFSDIVQKFTDLPRDFTMTVAPYNITVTLNGAELLAQMMPVIQEKSLEAVETKIAGLKQELRSGDV